MFPKRESTTDFFPLEFDALLLFSRERNKRMEHEMSQNIRFRGNFLFFFFSEKEDHVKQL